MKKALILLLLVAFSAACGVARPVVSEAADTMPAAELEVVAEGVVESAVEVDVEVDDGVTSPAFAVGEISPKNAFECKQGKVLSANQAKTLLVEVQKRYSAVDSLVADFKQDSFLAALDSSESSGGKVWFSKPGKMKWEYSLPEEQVFILKDQTFWHYQAVENQVLIDRVEDVLISDLPVAFLMGVGSLEKDFELVGGCTSGSGTVLKLSPLGGDPSDPLKQFELLVDTSKKLPRGARITHVGGNREIIVLNSVASRSSLELSTFEPSFPSSAATWDRRPLS